MTDDKKAPDDIDEVDWDQALSEWENKTFTPEVAKDTATDKPGALSGGPVSKPLYRPPVVPSAAPRPRPPVPSVAQGGPRQGAGRAASRAARLGAEATARPAGRPLRVRRRRRGQRDADRGHPARAPPRRGCVAEVVVAWRARAALRARGEARRQRGGVLRRVAAARACGAEAHERAPGRGHHEREGRRPVAPGSRRGRADAPAVAGRPGRARARRRDVRPLRRPRAAVGPVDAPRRRGGRRAPALVGAAAAPRGGGGRGGGRRRSPR